MAILTLVGILCGVGLVMVLSASAYTSLSDYGSVWTIFERQVEWMGFGVLGLLGALRIRLAVLRRFRIVLLFVTNLLLLAVLLPGVGVTAGGASRWIGVGQLRLQPSELAKLTVLLFSADLLARRADRVGESRQVVLPLLIVLGISGLLILKQPDMGTAMVLVCITFGLLLAGGVPIRPVAKMMALVVGLGTLVAVVDPYRRARLLSFLHPFSQASGSGYQVVQSLVGLGAGHLFGLGLGAGHEKWGLLPNSHTDFIFSVIGEETGLLGALAVLALFFALAWFGLQAAARAEDRFSSLLAVGITCWITGEAIINIGAVIGVLPVTGIPLPFVSFGGSSLVITMIAAGLLANIAGQKTRAAGRPGRTPGGVPVVSRTPEP
jgi:cell division protein FtsW